MNHVTFIGLLAGALTTIAFIPQLQQTWRTRSAQDVSPLPPLCMALAVVEQQFPLQLLHAAAEGVKPGGGVDGGHDLVRRVPDGQEARAESLMRTGQDGGQPIDVGRFPSVGRRCLVNWRLTVVTSHEERTSATGCDISARDPREVGSPA